METGGSLTLHCAACGWSAVASSISAWRCPQCGSGDVGAFATQEDDSNGVPELVFSELQKRRWWPTKFWADVVRRVRNCEITIDPQELARRMIPFVPGARDRDQPGRPRGGPWRDRAELEAALIAIITDMQKHRYVIDRESIACTLRLLLKEPHGRDDISRVVKEATRSRDQAKAARENLRR